MEVAGLLDIGQHFLVVGAGLVAVVEAEDTTTLGASFTLGREPVGQLVAEAVASGVRVGDTEVLHQHGGHVLLDDGQPQLLGHLVDDAGLTPTGRPLDSHRTADLDEGFEGIFEQCSTHNSVSLMRLVGVTDVVRPQHNDSTGVLIADLLGCHLVVEVLRQGRAISKAYSKQFHMFSTCW